jgi:molecular chaperone DnaJ
MTRMSSAARDFYDVLGVPPDADPETIKRAFRARARDCHPDVAVAPGAPERFRELANAYDVLSTPDARRLYDRFGYRGPGNGGFAVLSGIVAEVELEPDEAARGTARRVRFEALERCPGCDGNGVRANVPAATCARCSGRGRVSDTASLGGRRLLRIETCPDCGGSGKVAADLCGDCGGDGRVAVQRTAEVVVPRGAEDGQAVYLPAGEGRVVVRVLPPPDDSRLVRYGAAAGLLAALAFLALLLFS